MNFAKKFIALNCQLMKLTQFFSLSPFSSIRSFKLHNFDDVHFRDAQTHIHLDDCAQVECYNN